MRVLLTLHRIGPYHRVRLVAAAEAGLQLTVLQTRPQSQEYAWTFDPVGPYDIASLSGASDPEADPPRRLLAEQLDTLLDCIKPQAIVSVGWADRSYQTLLVIAHQRRIPVVLVSDSHQRDEPRNGGKEWLKRQLLHGYSSALVAGKESRDYLECLGFPSDAIFQPWDVVDNAFFARAASNTTFSQPHFLCVSRFVDVKNHAGLLQSYATYQREGGRWGLQLVGIGPLESAIRTQIVALPHPGRVQLLPFHQLEHLVSLYGQASAFVLASTKDTWGLVVNEAMAAGLPCLVSSACGCATDLIEHGVTGWCFDPRSSEQLAQLMRTAEAQLQIDRAAMVSAANQRLKAFAPKTFATALQQAISHAIVQPRFSRRAALSGFLLSCRSTLV